MCNSYHPSESMAVVPFCFVLFVSLPVWVSLKPFAYCRIFCLSTRNYNNIWALGPLQQGPNASKKLSFAALKLQFVGKQTETIKKQWLPRILLTPSLGLSSKPHRDDCLSVSSREGSIQFTYPSRASSHSLWVIRGAQPEVRWYWGGGSSYFNHCTCILDMNNKRQF